ncbi:hypothetical protein A6R68_18683, partial [Neotoma lepida]
YHALGVLYHLRKNDRLAVSKMLNKFTKCGLKSQFAYCMLIRIASRLLKESEDGSPKPALRYAAVRTLNKVVVVQAISALCQKYPRKHSVMMTFLSNMLRDDGGFEYKKAIVDCIISIVEENPESKEAGLAHLCEFIEDCEHTVLATKILHLLGKEGPRTPVPSKCMMDTDDEVRDRATFYLNVLQQRQMALNATYIFNGLTVSIPGMEKALHQYTLEPSDKPFDLKSVPLAMAPVFEQKSEIALVTPKPEKLAPSRQDIFQEQLAAIPEFMSLGPLFKSSEPVQLTEAETEYFVRCIKHVFTDHIVFQLSNGTFSCTMKFTVRDCDPNTGVPDEDGYDDEYVLWVVANVVIQNRHCGPRQRFPSGREQHGAHTPPLMVTYPRENTKKFMSRHPFGPVTCSYIFT